MQAHRFAWELAHGPAKAHWTDGEEADRVCVSHRCGNSRCVRVDHLYLAPLTEVRRTGRVKRNMQPVPSPDAQMVSRPAGENSERLHDTLGSSVSAKRQTGVSMLVPSLTCIDTRFTETLSALQSLQAALEETAHQQRRMAADLAAAAEWLRTAASAQTRGAGRVRPMFLVR